MAVETGKQSRETTKQGASTIVVSPEAAVRHPEWNSGGKWKSGVEKMELRYVSRFPMILI